jgi:hypothetical protein
MCHQKLPFLAIIEISINSILPIFGDVEDLISEVFIFKNSEISYNILKLLILLFFIIIKNIINEIIIYFYLIFVFIKVNIFQTIINC